jgi:hypothetical protein
MLQNLRMASKKGDIQLASIHDHGNPVRVLAQVRHLFCLSFPVRSFFLVADAFNLTRHLYNGRFPGYGPCSTEYHDFSHVLDVFAASARLLDGWMIDGGRASPEEAADLLIASLLHDAGYILESGDSGGTGAKYTRTHVGRSAAFVARNASTFHLDDNRADSIGRIILGTDLARPWKDLVFSDRGEEERAAILAAADILGQMGDRIYLEKLLFLYYEFREAGIEGYSSAYDILQKTLGFYESTKIRLDSTLASTAGLARLHFARRYNVDRDLYREAIQRQMDYLARIVSDDTANFRTKLKRMDLERIERERSEPKVAAKEEAI